MTKEREDFLRWKSQQTGGELIKEMFVLVDELRASNPRTCTWKRLVGEVVVPCQFQEGHHSGHSYDRLEP